MKSQRICTLTMLLAVAFVVSPMLLCSQAIGQIRSEEDTTAEEDTTNEEDPNTNGGVIGNAAGVSINALEVLRSLSTSEATNGLDALRRSSDRARSPQHLDPAAPVRRKPRATPPVRIAT